MLLFLVLCSTTLESQEKILVETNYQTLRVPIGYGGIGAYGANRDPLLVASTKTFTSIGDINNPVVGGLKDAVVVSHNHGITSGALKTGGPYGLKYASEFKFDSNYTTESTGESGTDKNLQPYIVTLFIQKISNP